MGLKAVLGHYIVAKIDSVILWLFGWHKAQIVPHMIHYADPVTGQFHLKKTALWICERRAQEARNAKTNKTPIK